MSKNGKMAVPNPDFDLVKRFNGGDEAAFNDIVKKYQKKIYWHVRRMTGNHFDADEVTQEVLIVIYDNLKKFRFQSSLYTWIYRITSTRTLNFINRSKVKRLLGIDESGVAELSSREDIIRNIEQRERFEELEQKLKLLPAKQREVFILRNFDDMSYKEISEITGRSEGGLKANYFHAVNKLTELMQADEHE
jgi:RNA polymerase sigma-70 factor (ECF subfamily)